MPKSKTRNVRRRPQTGFEGNASYVRPRIVQPAPEKALETATLALTQASLEIVREAELHITAAARAGVGVEEALEVHLHLRTASLGLLVAYSQLAGLPDPREGILPQD
jgi:hypothetical protein